jgi:cysteine desulfurase
MIYLDNAATTPVPTAVADAMYDVLTREFGNPSAQYPAGRNAGRLVAAWRKTVADSLGCGPERLYFTSCGTEGDNWAVEAACWQNRHLGKHIVVTAVEHSAVLEPCRWMERQGWEVTRLKPDGDGSLPAQRVLDAVRPDTALVCVMMVNNEIGSVYPIREIAGALRRKNPATLFLTDAVQGFLKIPFRAEELGVDFLSVSAHKIGGPKGIGALYLSQRVRNPRPLLAGGGQESGLRSGTEATAQIAGFARAVELRRIGDGLQAMEELRNYARARLSEIPDLTLIGGKTAPHILAASLVGYPSQNIVEDLAEKGICISAGSACHRGKPSHVVAALGLPKKVAAGVIRLSFGPENTPADIDACAAALRAHHDARFPML